MLHIPRLSGVSNNDFWLDDVCLINFLRPIIKPPHYRVTTSSCVAWAMVLVAGLEPARYFYRGILSPLRAAYFATPAYVKTLCSFEGLEPS